MLERGTPAGEWAKPGSYTSSVTGSSGDGSEQHGVWLHELNEYSMDRIR